jgi:hypothetical protein
MGAGEARAAFLSIGSKALATLFKKCRKIKKGDPNSKSYF